MPLTPRKDESQSAFMGRCMSELKDSETERPQEQMIAICLNAWRDREKSNRASERWSCGASRDLPIAETERDWDGPAAAARMLDKASNAEDEVNGAIARRGFLIYDAANPTLRGSYSCPFADIVDGTLKVIPSGLRAAASRLPQVTDVSVEVKGRARGVLDAYFEKLEEKGQHFKQIRPRNGENEVHFMERCAGRGIDKAKCEEMWNESANEKRLSKQDYDGYEAPDVEEDETRAEYIERCVADLTEEGASDEEASSLCALAWENRSGSRRLRQKTHAEIVSGMEFVLSDETPDRMGDVVTASGFDLTNFVKNPIALFNHRSDFPIGKWTNLRAEHGALRGHLQLAPEGTSDRIDEIRRLIEADILRAVSIGFRPIQSQPRRVGEKVVGEHFLRQELVETSLVSVPANPNALAIAKQYGISDATLDIVFAEHGRKDVIKRTVVNRSGEQAVTPLHRKEGAMSPLSQRIQERQTHLVALRDTMNDHLAEVDDDNVSDAQMERTKELNEQIKRENEHLAALVEAEKNTMGTTALARVEDRVVKANGGNGSITKPYAFTNAKPPQIPNTREARLDLVVRAGVVSAIAHMKKWNIDLARENIAREYPRYGDDGTKLFCDYISKAPTTPAMTTVAGWAEELVQQIHADYMELLYPRSVLPRLSPRGLSLSFGRAGRISIPTRSRTPSVSGSFVGEGMPIPVRQAEFTAQILTPKKMAVIVSWTREMDEASIPAIEGLMRRAIQEDTASTIDSMLLDTNNADAIRPAGLLSTAALPNGSGAIVVPPAAGGGFGALVADLRALSGALLGATQGNVRDMVYIMNPEQMLAASLTAMPGVSAFPFKDELGAGRLLNYGVIDSGTVPAGTIIAMDAADFVIVGGEAPRFEVSDQATLHYEDTNPEHINDGTPAAPVRSLWQTDSLALRLVLPLNWCMRRPGMVASISAVTW